MSVTMHLFALLVVAAGGRGDQPGGLTGKNSCRQQVKVIDANQGRCRVIAVIGEPTAIGAILRHLGLPTESPLVSAARAPPQLDLAQLDPAGHEHLGGHDFP